MRHREKGFMYVEMVVSIAVMSILAIVTGTFVFQLSRSTALTNEHSNAIWQAQNGSDWISNDTQMAESLVTDNLTFPNFMIISWTERSYTGGNSTYHTVTYFFSDLSGNVGNLKRHRWSSSGRNEEHVVARYIYYNPADVNNTSKATYDTHSSKLTMKLRAIFGNAIETKEYQTERRITYEY